MKTKLLFLLAGFLFFGKFIFAQTPTYTLRVDTMVCLDEPPFQSNVIEFGIYLTHTNAPTHFGLAGQQIFFSFNPEIVDCTVTDTANCLKYSIIDSQLPLPYRPRNPSVSTAINPSATVLRLAINAFQGTPGLDITGATNLLICKMRLWSRSQDFNVTWFALAWRNPPIVAFSTKLFAYINDVNTDITTPATHSIDSSFMPICLPVDLASFTSSVSRHNVTLNWATAGELNNSGFEVERLASRSGSMVNGQWSMVNGQWSIVGFIQGSGTCAIPKNYFFNDRGLSSGKYKYRLKQIDYNGNFEYFNLSNEVDVGIPTVYHISQNYPNPFNPSTKLDYDLPEDGRVSLIVYDISGREIVKLIDEFKTSGYYTIQFNANGLSSGIYFYRLSVNSPREADDYVMTKRMMMVK